MASTAGYLPGSGGILSGGGGSSKGNSVSKVALPGLKKGQRQIIKDAGTLYNSGAGYNTYPGDTYVPFSDQTQQALDQQQQLASQPNPLAQQSMDAISGILNGNNGITPEFERMVGVQKQSLADDINRQMGTMGAGGSSSHAMEIGRTLGNFSDQAYANQYNQGIANQLSAVSAAPGAYAQQYLPSQQLGQVGAAYDDLATRKLQSNIDKFNTTDMAGWNRLGAYSGALGGAAQYGPQQTTVTPPNNIFSNILGGAATGAGILSNHPGVGAAAGAGLGALSSLFH